MKFFTLSEKRDYLMSVCRKTEEKIKSRSVCGGSGRVGKPLAVLDQEYQHTTVCDCTKDENGEYIQLNDIEQEIKALEKQIAQIPPEYAKASLDKSPVKDKIFTFMNSQESLFGWAYGITGCGKTMVAYALKAYSLSNNKKPVKIVKDYELLKAFEQNTDFIEFPGLLVIDDIGAINSSGIANYYIDVYHRIIDYRRENHLKTLFTSNISIENWCKWVDSVDKLKAGRIISRFSGATMTIKFPDTDYRKNGGSL